MQNAALIPIRGQLIYVRARTTPYVLWMGHTGENTFSALAPRFSKNIFAIGGCLEKGEEEREMTPELCEKLLKDAQRWFERTETLP